MTTASMIERPAWDPSEIAPEFLSEFSRWREEMMHAARYERMFPGEGGIDLVSLTRAMPADIAVSIEVPTVGLARTMDAYTRARRALSAAKRVIAAAV